MKTNHALEGLLYHDDNINIKEVSLMLHVTIPTQITIFMDPVSTKKRNMFEVRKTPTQTIYIVYFSLVGIIVFSSIWMKNNCT